MQRIQDSTVVSTYIKKFPINDIFSFDMLPYLHLVQFNIGEFILNEGSTSEYLYYLIDGKAKLYLTHKNGKVSIINFIESPCFIGEMELIGTQAESNGVQALTICHCFAISVIDCKDKLLNDIKFLKYLCIFLSNKAINNTSNYTKNQSYPLENRLAAFILLTSNNLLYTEKHTETSEFLGVSYRHLLYVLADFCKTGILHKEDCGYKIINLSSLNKLVKEMGM
ncbi:MAG: CRP/FNR family putative post-exponential-phase nitrogen-starvation transcriptional regulator [Clostridium sp.]|jgi:CRP/FNR family putative post-exponential-phase nitrogen-starvation transcriptional regulator